MKRVLLTYDSFASHTTLNFTIKDKLELNTTYIGDLKINTYNGFIEEKGYQASAAIDGLQKRVELTSLLVVVVKIYQHRRF